MVEDKQKTEENTEQNQEQSYDVTYEPTHEDIYGVSWTVYMARVKFAEKLEEYKMLQEQLKFVADEDVTGLNGVIIRQILKKQKRISEYLKKLKDIIVAG